MNDHTIVIVTARLLPDGQGIHRLKAHHDRGSGGLPGYMGGDMIALPAGSREWTIMLNFSTSADAEAWRSSKERLQILAEGQKLLKVAFSAKWWKPKTKPGAQCHGGDFLKNQGRAGRCPSRVGCADAGGAGGVSRISGHVPATAG